MRTSLVSSVVARAIVFTCAGVVGAACGRDEAPQAERPAAVPIERSSVIAPRRIATSASFDLTVVGGGAFLVWGPPSISGGGVVGIALDRLGATVGSDAAVYAPPAPVGGSAAGPSERADAVEIVAASGGGRVGVVWVERDLADLSVRGAVGDPRVGAFSPARTLGASERTIVGGRGYVAIDGSANGSFGALVRGGDQRCAPNDAANCATFTVASLGAQGFAARGVSLVVPSPCPLAVVGFASAQSRFHYAICANADGRPATTVYSIQEEPQFARAESVLPGCDPEAIFSIGDEVVVSGSCAGGRAGARLSPGADALRPLAMDRLAISCSGPTPVVDTGRDGARLELTAPVSRVESLFPREIVPTRARAVWTGAALLVASPSEGEVVVRRYQCEDGQLRRTDVL